VLVTPEAGDAAGVVGVIGPSVTVADELATGFGLFKDAQLDKKAILKISANNRDWAVHRCMLCFLCSD
jgi:hypothetical protein